ncbi:MAG: hypothetical protein AAGA29_05885 [Planctomycetota bacterium]
MPNKAQLIEKAQALGVELTAGMTNKQIAAAIKAHQDDMPAEDEGASQGVSFRGKKLVEFNRHIVGPPRRSVGQRVWLTPALAKRQGITDDDITVITR